MKKIRLLLMLLLTAAPWAANAQLTPPVITNFFALQRTNTMFVDIHFDLNDPTSTNVWVLVEASSTGGSTYGVPITSLTGDIGWIVPGVGKHIIWNAWNDWANNYSTNMVVRLTADDSAKAITPITPPVPAPATNLVWIPSGSFNMTSVGAYVYLTKSFWMGKYTVSQAEFMSLMTNYNPSAHTGNTNLPVENMSWSQATNYCVLLTAREQAAGHITTNQVYRLPTDAEWEYAARAGTTTTFYYGNDPSNVRLPAYAWFNLNSGGQTQLGGSRIPNAWGLYDMMGNVLEWCLDWYSGSPYSGNVTDPQVTGDQGNGHVTRGGSFQDGASTLAISGDRAYARGGYPFIGFRIVLYPGQ